MGNSDPVSPAAHWLHAPLVPNTRPMGGVAAVSDVRMKGGRKGWRGGGGKKNGGESWGGKKRHNVTWAGEETWSDSDGDA